MARVGELSFASAVGVFVRVIVIVIEEGTGRSGCCLAGRFLKFTVQGFLTTPTLEVACEDDNENYTDNADKSEDPSNCACVFKESGTL
jgi:hypothetical protein